MFLRPFALISFFAGSIGSFGPGVYGPARHFAPSGECGPEGLTPAVATKVIQDAFSGAFEISSQRKRSADGFVMQSVTPSFETLDLNGDGRSDLVVVARYTGSHHWREGKMPFNFGTPNFGREQPDDRSIVWARSVSSSGESIDRQGSQGALFLLIIFGGRGGCWQESGEKDRFALANAMPFLDLKLTSYQGRLRQTEAGDSGPVPAPKLKGEAILFASAKTSDGQLIFWTGKWFNWYPASGVDGSN